MLTREKLKRLGVLMREADALEAQMETLYQKLRFGEHRVSDTVKGSSPDFPYTERVFSLVGNDAAEVNRLTKQIATRRQNLKRKKLQCLQEYESLTREIENVPDPLVRCILVYRYREGLSWAGVAKRIGGDNTADSVRMATERYLRDSMPAAQK